MSKSVYEILMTLTGGPKVTSDLNEAEKNVNLLSQASQAVTPALIGAGDAMLAFSERAILANANMERGLTNLMNITEGTREGMEQYNKDLGNVLESTGYQIQRNDLLTASYDAASAGFTDTADAMGVMSNAAKLAIAGNSGLTDATDNMDSSQKAVIAGLKSYGQELEQYGSTAEQAAVVSDKMYKIIKLGITDVSQLAPEFAELAPLAASAGLGLDELSASYAAMTSAGIKTTISTTNLKALLSSIARGGGTEESKAMIDELGLSFDTAALSTEGLVGILATLEEKGVTGMDQYIQLTGSVEAATALAALSAQDFAGKLDYVANASANLQDKVDTLKDDPLGRLTEATNRFDDALALAGANVLPIQSNLLDLGTTVLNVFNALPESVKGILGPMASVGGAALKSSGEILQMASNIAVARIAYFQWTAQVAAATTAQAAQTTTLTAATIAQGGFTASTLTAIGAQRGLGFTITATTASMGAFIAAAAAATAAIGVLTFALIEHEKNKATVLKNETIGEAYAETEVLAQKLQSLVFKMRETGEALPDAEFKQWMKLLEDADGGTGALKLQMEAFIRVQEKAKQGTLETTEALQAGAAANRDFAAEAQTAADKLALKKKADEEAAKAAEKQAEAAKKQEEANAKLLATLDKSLATTSTALSTFEQDMANKVADGSISAVQAYEQRAHALMVYAATVSAQYAKTMQAETLSAEQKADLLAKQTADLRANQQKQIELHRAWTAELRKVNDEQNQIELLALETRAYNEGWTQEKLTEETRKAKAEQLQATLATIEAELSAVAAGSQRQRELTLDLYRTKAELARNTGELAKDETAKLKAEEEKRVAAAKKAAEDAKAARVKAWQEETDLYKANLTAQENAASAAGQRITQALTAQASVLSIGGGEISNYEGALKTQAAAKQSILDITAKIAELEAQQAETGESKAAEINALTVDLELQRRIQTLTGVELEKSNKFLSDMGIKIGTNLTAEQATLAITAQKLSLENQQLSLKLQQETISIRLKKLEQDRLILELQRQATAEDTTAAEARNLQLQIANARETKSLLDQQQKANEQATGLQQRANASSARVGLASQGIDPKTLTDGLDASNTKLAGAVDQSFRANIDRVTAAQKDGADQVGAGLAEQAAAIEASMAGIGEGVTTGADKTTQGINNLSGNIQGGFGSAIAATQAQTAELRAQLAALQQATQALPGQIAQLMPRPAPQTRK